MTLTIQLPEELQRELSAEAKRLGLAVDEYALRLLSDRVQVVRGPRNGGELVAFWEAEGVIGSRDDVADAAAHARSLRARAEHRVRE